MAGAGAGASAGDVERWGGREQLWLAAAVARGGGWGAVSRALRACGAPAERCTAARCARQYAALQTRRPAASPHALLHRLTADRVQQLDHLMAEEVRVYAKLAEEVRELLSNSISEGRVRTMAAAVEAEQHAKAKQQAAALAVDKQWKRPERESPHSSPLLTSLLQSAVPINQTTEDSPPRPSPRSTVAGSSLDRVPFHDLEKIEQIKSELQKIEQNLIDGAASSFDVLGVVPTLHRGGKDPSSVDALKHGEKIDIDDIEIKAEDVYAFSDIDLDIPPVSSIHKSSVGRTPPSDKNLFNRRDLAPPEDVGGSPGDRDDVRPGESSIDEAAERSGVLPLDSSVSSKVFDVESSLPVDATQKETPTRIVASTVESVSTAENETPKSDSAVKKPGSSNANVDEDDSDGEMNQKVSEIKKDLDAKKTTEHVVDKNDMASDAMAKDNIVTDNKSAEKSFPKENLTKPIIIEEIIGSVVLGVDIKPDERNESHIETDDDTPIEVIKEDKPGKTKRDYSRKKTEKDDPTSPSADLDGMIANKMEFSDEIGSDNSQEPIEKKLIAKRFRNELSGSRSESPATPTDSLPNSPAPATPPLNATPNASLSSAEQDKDYRIWKKAICLVLNRLYALKYASLFLRPITDDQAPGYSQAVKKPMDLSTIRRNIDLGVIKTTQEFQRDVLLMLSNALMYNRTDHRVYSMTQDTIRDAIMELNLLLQAQAHAASQTPTLSRLTRPPRPASRSAGPPVKRKRGGNNDTPTGKKRKGDET